MLKQGNNLGNFRHHRDIQVNLTSSASDCIYASSVTASCLPCMPKYAQKTKKSGVKSDSKAKPACTGKFMNTFQGAFSCPQCSDEFDSEADLLVHVNSRCDGIHFNKTKQFVCPSCADTFGVQL